MGHLILRFAALVGLGVVAAATPTLAQLKPLAGQPKDGSISVTNTFQLVMAYNASRSGCSIQNKGSNTIYVFFGKLADATKDTSYELLPGQPLNCETASTVEIRSMYVTGTAGDKFTANEK